MAEILLRPARPGEGQFLFDVTLRSVRAMAAGHYTGEQIDHWMSGRTPGYYEKIIAGGGTLVACEGSQIVGFVDAVPGEITRLFLLPANAGKGLGKRLLEAGLVFAWRGHDGPIRVLATLNAESFYARHGFVRQGMTIHSGETGALPLDLVVMLRHGPPE